MNEYAVTWSIDVDAETPEQAVQRAVEMMLDPNGTATFFHVMWVGGDVLVDLNQLGSRPPSQEQRFWGDHACRSLDHDWDVTPPGVMFGPEWREGLPARDERVVSTCARCGVVRTYDHGTVTYRYPEATTRHES